MENVGPCTCVLLLKREESSPLPADPGKPTSSKEAMILDNLNAMRRDSQLCDVILSAEGTKFPAHRNVLAAQSPFFKAMFTTLMVESQQLEVPLQNVKPKVLELVLQYLYTSVMITNSNAESLLAAASYFQIDPLHEEVCCFLENQIDSVNCLGIWDLAESHSCTQLAEKAKTYALRHFEEVWHGDEFTMMSLDKLIELYKSDSLEVKREETVMNSALHWLKVNDERKEDFHKVLQHVRLVQLNLSYLQRNVVKIPAVQSSAECMQLVEEARDYHFLPEDRHEFQSLSIKRRKCSATMMGIVVADQSATPTNGRRCIYLYSPPTQGWKKLGDMPFPVCRFTIVTADECTVYLVGGRVNGTFSELSYRYNPQSDSWLQIASMSVGRDLPGLAIFYGYVYAVGGDGSSGGTLTSVERYDPRTNQWSTVKPMPEALEFPEVVAYQGMMYVVGFDSRSFLRYSYCTDTWEKLDPMPNPGWRACIVGGCIYVVGMQDTLDCYDIAKNKWEAKETLPMTGKEGDISVYDGRIYAIWSRSSMAGIVQCYDPSTNKWEILGPMPECFIDGVVRCSPLH